MSEIAFTAKVTSMQPTYDAQGYEYVRIELSYRPPTIPTMISTSMPSEISDAIRASRDMVKVIVPPQMQAQMRRYSQRLVLFLTIDEWDRVQQKYTIGDEYEVKVKLDGNINMTRI